ncbi:MAG: dihydropteroate synthase [Rhodoblastus sp.]|nr:dihydropteroate synthase [Rhodoblastus sp.]MCC2101398.1 dihydropteroate synthase [Hyphomicrobiales bacterium]MCC2107778.1 dihydropteroate synthase [Hyphomicrobiales bacterium]
MSQTATTMTARRDTFLRTVAERRSLMGILNVTPDSFSDGGKFAGRDAAVAQAKKLVVDGADIVDVGAESTRPGHTPITAEEEIRRLAPLLDALLAEVDAPFSIDTYKAETARYAVGRGVCVINDIWGLQRDPAMADAVAETGAAVVVMHNRESVDPALDIVADMKRFFARSLDLARQAGILRAHVMLDPGIGFGKTKEQNLAALRATDRLAAEFGLPVLIGVSRKSLFGLLIGADVDARLIGTIAANLATLARGARIFRVHDVAEHRAAFAVWDAIEHG